jgi:hypothetical protein
VEHVQNVVYLPVMTSATDTSGIKSALQTWGGVDIAMNFEGSSSGSSYYNATSAAYFENDSTIADHDVTIVGWNDNYAASNFATPPAGNGAWLVKNSWGTGWGNLGYFYISYYDACAGKTENAVFTAEPTTNYATNYQYDPFGYNAQYGTSTTDTAYGANIFTANSTGTLKAVSFWALAEDTQYTAQVYVNPTAGNPTSGTLMSTISGSANLTGYPYVGYYTENLTTTVPLTSGETFAVVVQFTTPGWYYPVPLQYKESGYNDQAPNAVAGQSFASVDGTTWTDLASYGASNSAVALIHAFESPTSAGGWGPWTSLGGQIKAGTSPAAANVSGQTDWFVVGTNNALYYTSTGSSSWTNLGGNLTSSPAAVSPASGVIDVFARGTNGALYTKHLLGGVWGAWTSLGGVLPAGTSPTACSWGASREDVFVQGTTGALYQNTWNVGGWSGWTNLGGVLTSSPAATSPASGVIDVFVRGTNGALYTKHYSGSWGAWTNLGGQIPAGTSPAACSWGASREDVFVQGTNGALYQNTWNGSGWSGWTNLGGQLTSSPAAASPASGTIDVGVRGTNGALYVKIYTGG